MLCMYCSVSRTVAVSKSTFFFATRSLLFPTRSLLTFSFAYLSISFSHVLTFEKLSSSVTSYTTMMPCAPR